ncbi:DUF4249 domain-containing protein [Spirosoma fluminis]
MRLWVLLLVSVALLGGPLACVDSEDLTLRSKLDILIVEGTVTNLVEPMKIRLNRSRPDQTLGRSIIFPVTKAKVSVVVDSTETITCHETVDGTYQLPSDFKGQVGHAYQLQFTLSDGTRYVSTQQIMQPVPPVARVTSEFNTASVLPVIDENYTGGHDVYADILDPVDVRNYYRWDWTLYEQQEWCRSCAGGIYAVNAVELLSRSLYQSTDQPYEDCFYPPVGSQAQNQLRNAIFDYPCRTKCWEILQSHDDINIFNDQYSNGGLIVRRPVAHIPYYQNKPCIVHIRQGSLTKDAYQYFNLLAQQTQKTGGLADTPPAIPAGNIHNVANSNEAVVGYFTASAVFIKPHYIDRRDTQGVPPGLFYALYGRLPKAEMPPPLGPDFIRNGPPRPPTAVCAPAEQRTSFKPAGWPD